MAAVGVTVYFSSKLSNTSSLPFSSFFPSLASNPCMYVCMYACTNVYFPLSMLLKEKGEKKKKKRNAILNAESRPSANAMSQ